MPVERKVITHRKTAPAWSRRNSREKVPFEKQREVSAQEKQKEKENTQDFMKWHVSELTASREFNARKDDGLYARSVIVPDTSHINWNPEEKKDGSGIQHTIRGGDSERIETKAEDSQESDMAD